MSLSSKKAEPPGEKSLKSIPEYSIRRAVESDAEGIKVLLDAYAARQLLLPRSAKEIQKHISRFIVAETEGTFIGCVAIRDYHEGLYEIRSLAVLSEHNGRGIGSALIKFATELIKSKEKSCRVFALTRRAPLFIKQGFKLVDKGLFPEKIWSDCAVCASKDNCDEDAVMLEIL